MNWAPKWEHGVYSGPRGQVAEAAMGMLCIPAVEQDWPAPPTDEEPKWDSEAFCDYSLTPCERA